MITPILLNRLRWKGYLIFMATNFLFVPLVYFCYPETANLTLEEIDYIFADESKNAVKWSLEMRKQRLSQGLGRRESLVPGALSRRTSMADGQKRGDIDGEMTLRESKEEERVEHNEKI